MEEDEETKRLNERRRVREERRKKQEEDDAKEELERKAREDERKARKDNRNKERNEREAQQKKELEEYIKRTEDERKQRREEREKRRIEEERIAKEDEEKRKRQQEERERKRREEDEEKKKRIRELEESRKRVLKELEDDENNSQVESILSLKKKRQAARQKIESILATIDPTNNQYSIVTSPADTTTTITNTAAGTKILKLLLTEELKEEVIDLVSSGFRSLIDYMSLPSSLSTMVEFLVDIQVGSMIFQSKFELHNGTASLELKNSLARIQASYEILKGGIPILAKIITDPVNSSILDILFGMISNPPPISTTNMHIFVDLVVSFMSRKPDLLVYICNNKDTILPSFMQHLSNSETVDLLLKMAEVEMTQFSDSSSSGSSSSGSAASSFFSLFTGSSSSGSNNATSTSLSSNTKEKPHWTSELTPYLILRINEICNFENVIMDQLDLEIDNITRLMFELVKKYPKSKVAHHLCGQSFSNSALRNGFKLALSLPYTSPISSSMLSLICTLVDSSIAMTQLSSSSTTTPDLPSVINLLFKQIVIVDVLDDDGQTTTRELSPIKAISEILTIKQENQIPLEIFSIVRLKVLHLIGSLVKANIPKLDREIWESGILKKCIDIFFQYETNNVIHCIIEGFLTPLIQRCLGSDDEEFMCHLLKDCSFISRVVNILSGGVGIENNNNSNGNGSGNVSTISSGTNSLSSGSGSLSGSSSGGVASRLSALFVNSSKDNNNNEIEQPSQKSEPIIGAPAPAMGSLSRGGGKKIRRKVSFFSDPNEDDSGADENSGGSGEVKLAIGDLSMFQSPVTTTTKTSANGNIVENQSNTDTNINTNTIADSEKKFSASLTMSPVSTTTATISSSSSSSLKNSGNSIINKSSSTTSSPSTSSPSSSLSKKEKELTKEQEKLKQKEKEKEILDMLKSKQLTADQEKEIKAQRKQEKKERKQKREEKKLAKRLKEKEKENGKSKLKNSSGSVSTSSSSSSSSKLKSSSSSVSPSSSPNITSSNNSSPSTSSSPSSSPPSSSPPSLSSTTTTTSSTTTTTIATSTTNSNILLSSDQASSDISKLSLNDNNNTIPSITDSSIEEQSVIVVYHEGEEEKTTAAVNTESCNNNININNIVEDVKSASSTTTTTSTITTTTPLSPAPTKKRVNHNVGHIISLCIEITHIVNKSKGQLLRDIVDECCLFQGQWDEVVVPKLKQEISYRASKPIGTVSMRKGRKGGPPTPFANVESFPNTANGVIIPPTETTSKFFF